MEETSGNASRWEPGRKIVLNKYLGRLLDIVFKPNERADQFQSDFRQYFLTVTTAEPERAGLMMIGSEIAELTLEGDSGLYSPSRQFHGPAPR
jgi:hypothetical protein